MKVAVTGASGFLGHYVCEALRNAEIDFQPLHFSTRPTFDEIGQKSKALDISSPPSDLFVVLGEPDVLIHLAWAGLPNYRNETHMSEELLVQKAFLEKAIDSGVGSIFVTGTCFEYGMQEGELFESTPLLPDNPYGEAKVELLKFLQAKQQASRFNLTWGRLFYMYGDGQSPNSLWSQFQATVDEGGSAFDMSAGQQTRDFLSVEKIAETIVELAAMQKDHGVVNVSSGNPVTVENLVQKWAEERDWRGTLNLGVYPYPTYEPMHFWGNRSKLDAIFSS